MENFPFIWETYDANWEVRSTIAKTLGKIGDTRVIKPLVTLLGDKSENVRWYALHALETITGYWGWVALRIHWPPVTRLRI